MHKINKSKLYISKAISAQMTGAGGQTEYRAVIINEDTKPAPVVFSLDIYRKLRPKHPSRHLGYWNVRLEAQPGETEILAEMRFPEVMFSSKNEKLSLDHRWLGPKPEDDLYSVDFCLYDGGASDSVPALSKIIRDQVILLGQGTEQEMIGRGWPGKVRRDPAFWEPDYITLASVARVVRGFAGTACPDRAQVLDIGCGVKPYFPYFSGKAKRYVGMDVVPGPFVDVIGPSHVLPFTDASMDVVISTQVLEHVEEPWRTVDEVYRILKPGGAVLASFPFVWELHAVPHDYWRFSSEGARRMFAKFSEIEIIANGGSVQCLIESLNLVIFRHIWPRGRIHAWKKALFASHNLLAKAFRGKDDDYEFAPNLTLTARKPIAAKKGDAHDG